ncbi:hypothetical protein HanXRQr2_Chr06g0240501 [Helianthus annuus]|uniref:Uncharacterized protein n=1 Tax=Helianthus annuus TaxID=4232 RepID=A0A9K3IQD7_HELAN|nr:hypothetical protein HanXRQr2_Chr06g0240501 [Helianthus annuus]KAJ0913865.1 hypothetical protein HanPSC8_Chr06g0232131 [Helianthus annuus]
MILDHVKQGTARFSNGSCPIFVRKVRCYLINKKENYGRYIYQDLNLALASL